MLSLIKVWNLKIVKIIEEKNRKIGKNGNN